MFFETANVHFIINILHVLEKLVDVLIVIMNVLMLKVNI